MIFLNEQHKELILKFADNQTHRLFSFEDAQNSF